MENNYYRNRARKRIVAGGIALILIAAVAWYFLHSALPMRLSALENSAVRVAAQQIVPASVSNPPPLVGAETTSTAAILPEADYALTRAGVISQTNVQRSQNGNLPTLQENSELDTIATLRLQDMFAKQYFAHVSPASSSALTVASSVGYHYVALGENLALGDFDGDSGVVTAWMGSPGHRANILDTHYTQIGVAVGKGIFDGSETWIAVQVFGRPASDCPPPDENLKNAVDANAAQLGTLFTNLQNQKANLDAMQKSGDPDYDQAAQNYNDLVAQYNALAAQQKQSVANYNAQVQWYNSCIAE